MDAVRVINRRIFHGGCILELEFCDLSPSAEKTHRFQWYLIINDTRFELAFLEVKDGIRYLNYGGIMATLDLDRNTLKFGKNTYALGT